MFLPDGQIRIADGGPLLVGAVRADAGVERNGVSLAVDPGASREDMLFAFFERGPERDWLVLPMHEVLTACVSPVHVSPFIAVGIVLVEDVVIPLVIDRPVRIVHPIRRRPEVVDGPCWIGFRLRDGGFHALHGFGDGRIDFGAVTGTYN